MGRDSGPADNGNGHAAGGEGDALLGFTLPARSGRGRLVRIDDTLNAILSAHAYPAPAARLLAEALVLTALIGATLRAGEGQTTLQARAEGGAIDLLVADYRAGELRGYVGFDAGRAEALGEHPDLSALFGEGYLAVTLDQSSEAERYQGIVPLEGASLCEAAASYFESSEQIPTLLRAAVRHGEEGWRAGGLLLQHLPRGEEGGERLHVGGSRGDWRHLEALGATVGAEELLDASLPLRTLLWRLFNQDEVRTTPPVPLGRGCRCSAQHIGEVLGRMPESERAEMRDADGLVRVDCEFCSRQFEVRV